MGFILMYLSFVYSLISYPFSVIITGYFIQLSDVILKKRIPYKTWESTPLPISSEFSFTGSHLYSVYIVILMWDSWSTLHLKNALKLLYW